MFYLWNEDNENEYHQRWMSFAANFAENKPEDEDPSTLLEWVEEVVSKFSAEFDLCDRLVNYERKETE